MHTKKVNSHEMEIILRVSDLNNFQLDNKKNLNSEDFFYVFVRLHSTLSSIE